MNQTIQHPTYIYYVFRIFQILVVCYTYISYTHFRFRFTLSRWRFFSLLLSYCLLSIQFNTILRNVLRLESWKKRFTHIFIFTWLNTTSQTHIQNFNSIQLGILTFYAFTLFCYLLSLSFPYSLSLSLNLSLAFAVSFSFFIFFFYFPFSPFPLLQPKQLEKAPFMHHNERWLKKKTKFYVLLLEKLLILMKSAFNSPTAMIFFEYS